MPQELSGRLLGSRALDAGALLQIATWFRLEVLTAAPDEAPPAERVYALSVLIPLISLHAVMRFRHQRYKSLILPMLPTSG